MMNSSLISSDVEYEKKDKNLNNDDSNDNNTENFCDIKENLENIADIELKMKNAKKRIPFWAEDPNILFHQKYMFEFFPVSNMSYQQKLNAITRTVILLVLFSFGYSNNIRILIIGMITLLAIFTLHHFHIKDKMKRESKRADGKTTENFSSPAVDYLRDNNLSPADDVFESSDSSNPFGNVLVSDYDYNPNKKPAPPSYNKNVEDTILNNAKQFVNDANPDHPNIANKLFSDMGSNLEFEQSLRPFSSNPNTTIPNDQAGFAEFCYGSMISCKEGNEFACARNLSRHIN